MMHRTTVCPACGRGIELRWTLSRKRKDLRRCHQCGQLLFRVNTDCQPWTMLIFLMVLSPVVAAPLVAFYFSSTLRWWCVPVLLGGLAGSLLMDALQFPFTNGYARWYPTCHDCGYDMRSSPGPCPECGGRAMRHPEASPAPGLEPPVLPNPR